MIAGFTTNPVLADGFDQTITALDLVPVTPNDDEDLPQTARALRVGGTGTLRITTYAGSVRNTTIYVAGEVLLVSVLRVHASGTSATNIEAML